ncbi:hypothetical protein [Nonomuraea basaltis]|uniref:hypothetical protein n=1 Tax=Nonomuraea basaltis TaxID=2495887 RepID=UPI00110C5F93|nr:hypothetical protein [Nonomuraea basaltis]TMR88118.1 hypothetical protein EJK15_67975 [Nonomuraea basaltis]
MTLLEDLASWWNGLDWSQAQWGPIPAWLGLLFTFITLTTGLVTWVAKRRTRRLRRAMGPADDLRDALKTIRRLFQDIAAEPRRSPWFIDEQRREAGQRLRDEAERLDDAKLQKHVRSAADAWDAAFAAAPPSEGPFIAYAGSDTIISARSDQQRAADGPRFAMQSEQAHAGLSAVGAALERLNRLERKVVGRS